MHDFLTVGAAAPLQEAAVTGLNFGDDYYRALQKTYTEKRNLFLSGIVPLMGYPSAIVTYERAERFAGATKYPLRKMLAFAIEGITSFSVKPLRLIAWLGALIMAISAVAMLIWACCGGGSSLIACSIWLMGGIQLLCTGVLGEYIGKIYSEVKRRPLYFIEKYSGSDRSC